MLTDCEFVEESLEVLKSLAGYDTNEDSILKASINMLMAFEDYWIREPYYNEYRRVAKIITGTIFQINDSETIVRS